MFKEATLFSTTAFFVVIVSLCGTTALASEPVAEQASQSSSSSVGGTPARVISLANWTLQLPTGSSGHPDAISASALVAGFQNAYFQYDASDNSVVFFAPDNGVTTANSTHPRSELREMQADGTTPANWDPFDSMTHTLSATLKVTDARHRLCVGQIHIGSVLRGLHWALTKPLVEIYYEPSGDIRVGMNGSPFSGQTESWIGHVTVGTKFSYEIIVHSGLLKIYLNGKEEYSRTVPSGFEDYGQYFKAGNYNQTKSYGGDGGTTNAFYALSISHQ